MPGEQQSPAFMLIADAVADEHAAESGGQFGSKIAHLVSVRHEHQARLARGQKLLQSVGEGVRSVRLEFGRLHGIDLAHLLARNLASEVGNAAANHCRFQRPAGLRGNSLSGS